jgi:hypothetical protein
LTVIAPLVCVWIGLGLTATFGAAVFGGELTAVDVGPDDDGLGLSDVATPEL